jgi:replication factor A1
MDSNKEIETSAEKVIKLFKEKEIDLPKKSVIDDLERLVSGELELPLNDAIRAIIGKYGRQHNIKIQFGGTSSGEIVPIKDLQPNTWITVEAEVVEVSKPDNKRIHQTAIVTDGSGSVKLTVWNRKPDEPHVPDLIPGKWYKISNAVVNVYNDLKSISIQKSTNIAEIEKKHKFEPTFTKVIDIKPGIVNIKGKVTRLFDAKSDKVAQSGIIGDETGSINFVIWASSKPKKKLSEGKIYITLFAACNKFNDKISLALCADETTETKGTMDVKTSNITMIGNLVTINEGSGVIRRCPIEGCNRTLSRQNYCTTHEIQKDFKYDMRIKGVIDDGNEAKYIHVSLKLTEELLGMTLTEAVKKAENNPLGADGILLELREKLVGKYYHIEGNDMDGRIIVSSMKPLKLEDMKQSTGLDFKESPQTKIADGV